MMPQTFMGFDYGELRVGVAVGNTLTGDSRPLTTIAATGNERWLRIAALIAEWQPQKVVVGVPFHPDGAEHENTRRARRFARQLHGRYGLDVIEADERYTTTAAHEAGARGDALDARSAAIILDQYLRSLL